MLCLSKDADKLIQLQSWEPTKKQSQILREGSIFLKRKTTKSRCNTWRPWQNDRMRGGCGVSWLSRCDGCSVLADAGWCWHCSRHTWPIRQSVRRRQHGPAPASWPANTTSHLQSQPSPLDPLNSDIYKCSKIYQFSQLLLYKLLYTCPARGSYSRNGPRNSVKLRMKLSGGKNEITLK